MSTSTLPAPSPGALRAAVAILHPHTSITASADAVAAARIIDRETRGTLGPATGNTASDYCATLDSLSREELINAAHWALMQFEAIAKHETLALVDNRRTVAELRRIMRKAGHLGFAPESVREGVQP